MLLADTLAAIERLQKQIKQLQAVVLKLVAKRAYETERLEDKLLSLATQNERLRAELDQICGMCMGNIDIGKTHEKARGALERAREPESGEKP
jgi:hypothetical protein